MIKTLKKTIFQSLSLENYLRVLQRSYFFLYQSKLLKFSNNYTYHYYIKRFINKGDTVIDIGANLGYYSILFAKWVSDTGKVHSIEPIRIYNKIFNEKAKKYSNIILYPYALGTEEKNVQLVSSPHTGYLNTGLPHVHDEEKDGKLENVEFAFEAEMKVPSKLFSSLNKIDYIKCDIEGFEYIVLSDMKSIIEKHQPIVQVEVWHDNQLDVERLFMELNYLPYKIMKGKLVPIEKHTDIHGDYIFLPPNKREI